MMAPHAKTEGKVKALKVKQAVLKGTRILKNERSTHHPPSRGPRPFGSRGSPNPHERACPRRNKLNYYAIIQCPLTTESARKKTEDKTILLCSLWTSRPTSTRSHSCEKAL